MIVMYIFECHVPTFTSGDVIRFDSTILSDINIFACK